MSIELRKSGISTIGNVPWGTHFCLFYKTREDLADILIAFFEEGLRNNEFCMCFTADNMDAEEMERLLRTALPDYDVRLRMGQIEIVPHDQWYLINGVFDRDRVLKGWADKLKQAQDRGFDGARVTGNTFWLDKPVWRDFMDYEAAIDGAIEGRNFLVLCTYSLDQCGANEIVDVMSTHQFALMKKDGVWKLIEHKDMKETRRALRESEEKYRLIVETAEEGIWVVGGDDRTVFVNQKMADLLGYSVSEMIGRGPCEFMGEEAGAAAAQDIRRCRQGETFRVKRKFCRKDGTELWVILSLSPFRETDGTPGDILAMIIDVSDLVKAEKEMHEAKMQAEMYLDLMGHDINNMNQIAITNLELAAEMLDIPPEGISLIHKPLDMLKNSSRLIENVRKLQKVREGTMAIERIDLGRLLDELKEHYSSVPGKEVSIRLERTDSLVEANGLLRDVFANIIGNAIKHAEGIVPVEIDIRMTNAEEDGKRFCRISIEDNGPGIPDEQKVKVFHRFSRGQTKAHGKGLGLYLVKTLVDSYNGKVWVEDRVAGDHTRGARFVVMLPAL